MAKKACTTCRVEYPVTKEFWHRDNSAHDGFRSTCKMCRAEEVEKNRRKKLDDRVSKIEDAGIDLLDNMSKGGSSVPHMAETFQKIMEAFGGPGGFSQQVMSTFYKAAPGSLQRQRILEAVLRLNIKVSESGAAQKSLEELTNEELDKEIQESFQSFIDPDISILHKIIPADDKPTESK
tara:strand:- start:8234 stop:8770 length:537 start_codon:yes stop_codon:yes gene_type:complete